MGFETLEYGIDGIPMVGFPGGVDDTGRIVDAMNAIANKGYGVLGMQPGRYKLLESIAPVENVTLIGAGSGSRAAVNPPTILDGSALAAPIFDGGALCFGLRDLALYGQNVSGSMGVHATNATGWKLRDLFFNNFGDYAVQVTAGNVMRVEDVKAQNCLLVRAGRAGYVGVIDLAGNDHFIDGCELTSSSAGNDSGSGFIAAMVVRGDNGQLGSRCIFELSETGLVVVASAQTAGWRIIGTRADQNKCDGYVIAGNNCDLVAALSYRNSQSVNNTFDGFVVSGTGNKLIGTRSTSLGADPSKMRYGIRDASGVSGSNKYLSYETANMATAATLNITAAAAGYGATT